MEEKKFVCECGRSFDKIRGMTGHQKNCQTHKDIIKQKKEARRLPNGMFKCENPDCGKEHDGSYGSGRFCSKHCKCSFNAKKCKKYPTKQELAARGFGGFGTKPKSDGWKCTKCGIKFKTRSQLRQHLKNIKHPNNQNWAKGLTKETSDIIRQIGKKVSKSLKEGHQSGRIKVSDEYRKQMSDIKKKFYSEHPEQHPMRKVCGNRSKMTYPEQVVFDWLLQNQIKFIHQFQWQFLNLDNKIHKRFVDFYIPQYKLFIEVDGKYWHQNRLDEDRQKDIQAEKDGFSTLRIDPAKLIINQLQYRLLNKENL